MLLIILFFASTLSLLSLDAANKVPIPTQSAPASRTSFISCDVPKTEYNINSNNNILRTELEILKSPSVLMPIFEFVKSKKSQDGKDLASWSYNEWRESHLQIELIKDTKILNLAYKDNDKDLIIPVLDKISKEYQNYSNRDREKGISEGVTYIDEQVKIYKEKAKNKFIEAQRFAIDNDLLIPSGNVSMQENAANIELARIAAVNKQRDANELKKRMLNTSEPEKIKYLASYIFKFAGEPSLDLESLIKLESRLDSERKKYKETDRYIKVLKKDRIRLIEKLKEDSLKLLDVQIQSLQSKNIASSRPKEILLNFRKLLREFNREESTLNNLEIQKRILALEKAKEVAQPWELITKPTLFDRRISPKRKRIVFIFMVGGFVVSLIYISIFEKIRGITYEKKELEKLVKLPLLLHFTKENKSHFEESMTLLMQGPLEFLKDKNQKIALIPLGNIDKDKIEIIVNKLKNKFEEQVLLTKDLVVAKECSSQILLASLGQTSNNDISIFQEKVIMQNLPTLGWILLDY